MKRRVFIKTLIFTLGTSIIGKIKPLFAWYGPHAADISHRGTDFTKDANCQGAWFMNNNGGDETDRSGNNETLTHSSAPPTSATVPGGYSGTSRDFELGDPDFLYHADGGSTDISGVDQAITVAAWVNPESATNTVHQGVVSKYEGGTNDWRQYMLGIYGTAANEYLVRARISSDGTSGNTTVVDSTTTNYPVGVWHHIAMVYNDTDLRVYVDGSLHCTPGAHTAGIYDSQTAFRVGALAWNESDDDHFDGLIDEVGIWDRALSATEIAELYETGLAGDKGRSD